MAWRQPKSLREWLGLISGHKKKFLFPAIAVMIGVVISSHWKPRTYTARAMFERINDSALEQMGSSTINRNLRTIRQGLGHEMKGRAAIEQLIDDLQLLRDLPHTADGELTTEAQLAKFDMIRNLQRRIRVRSRIRSLHLDRILVSFTDEDRKLAPQLVNQLVENYIRNTRRQLDEMLLNAKTFFQREVDRYAARVTELDSKRLRFELDHPGLDPDNPGSIEIVLAGLQARLAEASINMSVTKEKRGRLQEWAQGQPEFIETSQRGQNPELVVINQKKASLQNELENHIYNMGRTNEHPAVVRATTRLLELEEMAKQLEDQIVVGVELVPNTNRISAEREVESLSGTLVALERQVEQLAKAVEKKEVFKRNFFVIRNEYLEMNGKLKSAKSQLGFWGGNLKKTVTALTAEIGQRGVRLRLIERATDLARPSNPTLSSIMMSALVMGSAVGGVLVILSELLDRSFRNAEQAVDELNLPVFGTVNEILSPGDLFRARVMSWGVYPAIGTAMIFVLLACIWTSNLSLSDPHRYEQLIKSPTQFINQAIFGKG